MKFCSCAEHPGAPELCCPTRGHFNCAGKYQMPPLPAGVVCAVKFRATQQALWSPDDRPLSEVAEAAEAVLSDATGTYSSLDRHQATYLLTTFARLAAAQYVRGSSAEDIQSSTGGKS